MTKNYAVIGHPIQHSLSPLIHSEFAKQCKIDISYTKIEATKDNFTKAVQEFVNSNGMGLNITIPHKYAALQLADTASDAANKAFAANTLIRASNNKWHADNTDGIGLIRHLQKLNLKLDNKEILILGAGGAVWGIAEPLLQQRPKHIHIHNRTPIKAQQLANHFHKYNIQAIDSTKNKAYDIIINATPSGIDGTSIDLPKQLLKPNGCCYDLGYNQQQDTPFVAWGKQHNAQIATDGIGMLIEQAAESFRLWHHIQPDTEPLYKTLNR